MENKQIKMLIENADLMSLGKREERLEIAKQVLPVTIQQDFGFQHIGVSVRRALDIADELLRQHNQQMENKNE